MPGINLVVLVLLVMRSAHHCACLLMEGADADSTVSRLDALEAMLTEEKEARLNLSAELKAEKQQRINDLNEEKLLRMNLSSELKAEKQQRINDLNEEKLLRMDLSVDLCSEKQQRLNVSAELSSELKQLRTQLDQRMLQVEARGSHTGYPAFMAGLSSSIDPCSVDQPIIFRDVKLNVVGAYSAQHGVFTAPIAGTYVFTTTLTPRLNSNYHVMMVKNEVRNEIGYLFANDMTVYFQNSITVVVHLNVAEEVWMVCHGTSHIIGPTLHSHMSGFLISPDP